MIDSAVVNERHEPSIHEMLFEHGKDIKDNKESITQILIAIGQLTESQARSNELVDKMTMSTDRKMEDIVKVFVKQETLIERLENMDKNTKESFNRVHDKIREIEGTQNSDLGCNALKVMRNEKGHFEDRLDSLEGTRKYFGVTIVTSVLLAILASIGLKTGI